MNNLIIVVISFLIIFGEIVFDQHRWDKGKDDKPISTWLRAAIFIIVAILAGLGQESFLISGVTTGLFLFSMHLMFFNPALNKFRKMGLFERKEGEIWNRLPIYGEYFIKAVFLYSTWAATFHWEWVQGNGYPNTLIEYFMF